MSTRRVLTFAGATVALAATAYGFTTRQAALAEARGEWVSVIDGVKVEYHLTPAAVAALPTLSSTDFDVDSAGHILISSDSGLLELTTGSNQVKVDRLTSRAPESFALDGQGALLGVSERLFGQWQDTAFTQVVPLPYGGMRLMPSTLAGVTYLIGGIGQSARRIYTFFADGTMHIEAEIPDTVVAVTDNAKAVYVASAANLYRVTSDTIVVIARLPASVGHIRSIAVTPADDALYFATDSVTYVMSGIAAVALAQDIGGALRMRNGRLYVWSPSRRLLVSLSSVTEAMEQLKADL
ncbi:MAG: hypothetical protein ACR2G6_17710 [Gemmatimonadaceae bacterium]